MRVCVAAPGTSDAPYRSLCGSPPTAKLVSLLLLFPMDGPLASNDAVASLRLVQEDVFAVRAASLCLPPSPAEEQQSHALKLLRHAVCHEPSLRTGSALVARPAAELDASFLSSVGFAPAAEATGEAAGELCFTARRDLADGALDGSHVALRVSDIEGSLAFWSLLHFRPTRTFTTSGARAAWLSSPWSSLSLELIEVPSILLSSTPRPSPDALGLAHASIDLTPISTNLVQTLSALQRASEGRFGKTLAVLQPPQQQMMGDLVTEVTIVRAPDGVQLELLRRAGRIEGVKPDWAPAGGVAEAPPPAGGADAATPTGDT